MRVDSGTSASRDTFEAHRAWLRGLEGAFPLVPGQCGAVLALGDDLCLDAVSRRMRSHSSGQKLRAGYLLDALERLDGRARSGASRRSSTRCRRRARRAGRRRGSGRTCGSVAPA
jgi:hypothetical protein